MTVDLCIQLGLDGVEQLAVYNGDLFALEDLPLERYFANIEAIAKQVGERPTCERDSTDLLSRLERPYLGDDPPLAQVGHQQVEAAELEIAAEYGPDALGLVLIDR